MSIPWEPQRERANKARVLVEKEGYRPKVVEFTKNIKFFIALLIVSSLLGVLGSMINHNLGVSGCILAIIAIVAGANFSTGSGDLYVELEKL